MPKILISKAFSFFYIKVCFVIDKWHNISGGKSGKKCHDLLSIAENAGLFSQKFKPFKYQQDLKTLRIVLQHLSDMVIWGAKYPVPNGSNKYFKFDNSVLLILFYGFHILDVIEPVFNLFEKELLKLNK